MTKLLPIAITFILTFSCSQTSAAVNWFNEETRTAVDAMATRVCDNAARFEDIDWAGYSFQDKTGEDAVKYLLTAARSLGNASSAKPKYDSPNIFSLLGIALIEGKILEKNFEDGAKFLVWGHHLETLVTATVERAIAHGYVPEGVHELYYLPEENFDTAIPALQAALETRASTTAP